MTGRRRAERRRVQALWGIENRRTPHDRREFLRRMSDLGAELEALNARQGRESLITALRRKLNERGVA